MAPVVPVCPCISWQQFSSTSVTYATRLKDFVIDEVVAVYRVVESLCTVEADVVSLKDIFKDCAAFRTIDSVTIICYVVASDYAGFRCYGSCCPSYRIIDYAVAC